MNSVIADLPDREIHVVLDNLNTHKPKRDLRLARHPNMRFHYTPTHASLMNQVEIWFSILSRNALHGASFISPKQVRTQIDAFIERYKQKPSRSPGRPQLSDKKTSERVSLIHDSG